MAHPFDSSAQWLPKTNKPVYKSYRTRLVEENPVLFQYFSGTLPDLRTLRIKPSRNNMQSSESHPDLQSLEKLSLEGNRTNASTPVARHKPAGPHSRSVIMTPPENEAPEPSTNVQGIYLSSKDDDDVFSEDVQPRTSAVPTSLPLAVPVVGNEVIEYNSSNAKQAPRGDRLNAPVTPGNAQGVLPPDALVFVANLAMDCTDEQLEHSCHQTFDQYGKCHVKVRRDKHKHPFALIQYYEARNADAAIEGGRNLIVDGRKIRTEHAQARREYIAQNGDTGSSVSTGSVVLSRVSGGAVTREEAEELLAHYGPIEQMQPTTHQDKRLHGVPEGMWVKFAYYLDFKDAVKGFNNTTSLYQVTEPPNLEPRTRHVAGGAPIVQGLRTPRSSTDQKSIFVGNLPSDTEEAELLEIFSRYGEIKGCNIIRKPITGGQGFNIFGFIEFVNVGQADHAAESEIDIRGQRIRVEPKEYSARRHTRLQPFGQSPIQERQPRTINWGPSANTYQPAHAMPGGFYPVYAQSPMNGFSPFHQGMYGYAATPPNSGGRRGGQPGYMIHGSPHPAAQYIPIGYGPAGTQAIQDPNQDDHQMQHQRYQ